MERYTPGRHSLVPPKNAMPDELERTKGNLCPPVACHTHVENYQVRGPNGSGLRRVLNRISIPWDKPPLGSIQVAKEWRRPNEKAGEPWRTSKHGPTSQNVSLSYPDPLMVSVQPPAFPRAFQPIEDAFEATKADRRLPKQGGIGVRTAQMGVHVITNCAREVQARVERF